MKDLPKLFPYQVEGAHWLSTMKVALLADDMGLGKSAQAITGSDHVSAKRILVICPGIARINWEREFVKFSNRQRSFQTIRDQKQKIWDKEKSIITSYDCCLHVDDPGEFDLIIIDESHYLKSLDAKRTAAIMGAKGLVHKSKRTWAMSGTPAANHAGELWVLLYTFGVTPLTYDQFVTKFCNSYLGSWGKVITGNKESAIPELKNLLSKIMLRRKKEKVMTQLPKITYSHILVERGEVDLTTCMSFTEYIGRELELKAKLVKEQAIVEHVLSIDDPHERLRACEAMAGSVSTLRRYIGMQKVQAVADTIFDELENNAYEKIVIFALHRDVIEALKIKLEKFGIVTLYGGQDDEKKQKHMDRFQNNKKCRVIACNILAAGTAITLTAADQVAFIEEDWVPGNNAQAVMRVHRIGQTRNVLVRVFGLAESVDQKISNTLKRKMKELTQIFDDENDINASSSVLTNSKHDYNSKHVENTHSPKTFEELLE